MTYVEDYYRSKTRTSGSDVIYSNGWSYEDNETTYTKFYDGLKFQLHDYLYTRATSENIYKIEQTIQTPENNSRTYDEPL